MPEQDIAELRGDDSSLGTKLAEQAEMLAALEVLCRGAGAEWNPTAARRALRQAEVDIPADDDRGVRQRWVQAAGDLGLRILVRKLSVVEAFAHGTKPLAACAERTKKWFVLVESRGSTGRFARLGPTDAVRSVSVQDAERLLEIDSGAPVEWLVAQPAKPFESGQSEPAPMGHHGHAHHGPSPLARLIQLFRPEARDIWVIITYALIVGFLSLATPITALAVVNTTAMATLIQQLIILCLALFVSLAIAALIQALQGVVLEYLQRRIFVRIVSDLAFRLPRIEILAFDRQHGPELVNRFFDVLTVQKTSASLLLDGLSVLLQMAIGLILLATYHQYLLGFDILLIASLFFIVFVLGRGAVATSIAESRAKYAVASWLQEMARHPAAFKLHGAPDFAFEQADALARSYLLYRHSHYSIVLRQVVFALALQAITSVSLLGLGGYLVIQGELTLGQLVAAEIVVALVVASFTKLGKHLENYYDLLAAVDKLGYLVDVPLERGDGSTFQPSAQAAAVSLRNVSFRYEHGHNDVIHALDLDVLSGERVAILGPNGAGKSTLVELLLGLRTPTTGFIEFDGQDVRNLRLDSLRQHVSLASGIEIFEGSILDNVRVGRENLTVAHVRQALADVCLLEDIQELPQGLNAELGTGGSPLSLGQTERLMLARAIVGRPRLLILDELLDDMDASVREEVLPAIMRPNADWTLLVVTHSDDVARLCGRSVRLKKRHGATPSHGTE